MADLGAVDLHTHVYLPRYMDLLRSRRDVPFVRSLGGAEERLVILPDEQKQIEAGGDDASIAFGRPIGAEYWDAGVKLAYMDRHGIAVSVLSLANPWLDFLPLQDQVAMATSLNKDVDELCKGSNGRFLAFGVVPQQVDAAVDELERLATLPHLRGVILSTAGLGNKGLDDQAMLQFYRTAERLKLTLFVHPHYGVGNEHYHDYGHALFLALGFPFESTVAVSRLILSGLLDQVPRLQLLMAHAGGALPFLAGRLDSCVAHDPAVRDRLELEPSAYLKRFYFDAIAYHPPALQCLLSLVGRDRVVFGTDHPFFPPAGDEEDWTSTLTNYAAMADLDADTQTAILHGNAAKLLDL